MAPDARKRQHEMLQLLKRLDDVLRCERRGGISNEKSLTPQNYFHLIVFTPKFCMIRNNKAEFLVKDNP